MTSTTTVPMTVSAATQVAAIITNPDTVIAGWPYAERPEAPVALGRALETMTGQADAAQRVGRENVGRAFFDALVREGIDVGVVTPSMVEAVGDLLILHAPWVERYQPVPLFPAPSGDLCKFHQDAVARLHGWMIDGVDDVKSGVDEQAVYFADKWPSWVTDSCATEGSTKDYIGACMRYKSALLRGEEPSGIQTEQIRPGYAYRTLSDRPFSTPLLTGDPFWVVNTSGERTIRVVDKVGRSWWMPRSECLERYTDEVVYPPGIDRVPTEGEAALIGHRLIETFGLSVAEFSDIPEVTGPSSLESFLTTQVRGNTYRTLLDASAHYLMTWSFPSAATAAFCRAVDGAFDPRQTAGEMAQRAIRSQMPLDEERDKVDQAAVAELTLATLEGQPEFVAMRVERDRLREWQRQAINDMATLSEILNEEARSRNWCSEYDQVQDKANGRMQVLVMDSREHNYRVEIEAEVTLSIADTEFTGVMNVTLYVSAPNDPDMGDYVEDSDVRDAVYEALPSGVDRSFDVTSWTIEDYEVDD